MDSRAVFDALSQRSIKIANDWIGAIVLGGFLGAAVMVIALTAWIMLAAFLPR